MIAGGGGRLQALGTALRRWVDSHAGIAEHQAEGPLRVDWLRVAPFLGLHLACLAVIWVGWSWFSVAAALALYLVRMFSITGFYHRYFSHRTFKTSRAGQFAFALLGMTSVQRGPLWWAAHHRHHHAHSDEEEDVHSPRLHGMLWAHVGWITARANFPTRLRLVPDLAKFPELRFLDRFDVLVPVLFAAALFGLGEALEAWAPALSVTGPQLLVWGFCISTVALLHGTFTINSLAHRIGRRRYPTEGRQPQQLAAGADHAGRGVAQQPPPLPRRGAPGVLLVGVRPHLLRAARAEVAGRDLGPEAGAGAGPGLLADGTGGGLSRGEAA